MPNRTFTLSVAAVAALAATSLLAFHDQDTAPLLSQSASHFLASLNADQAGKAKFAFTDEERFNWHFIPRDRKGLPLREMTPYQKHLASALLSSALSQRGYIKATSIMSLEDVLKIMEKDDGERRNPEKYYFSIFGEPSEKGTWAFRVEGHHVALNFTMANGAVTGGPTFFGANPAEVREGPRKGLRVLHAEEDLGRDLLQSLTADQKKVAIVDKTANKDIITMASRKASLQGQAAGLSAAKMTGPQRELLMRLIHEYTDNVPEPVANARQALIKKAGNNISFAWTGVEEKGGPHYYRIQTPDVIIEYDNTQNNANHIHSVWRDINNDFGGDALAKHYAENKHDHN